MHQSFPPLRAMTNQKPVRLTITVTPQVHAAFERLSEASGQSMSKCMGEWLGDTLDAVEYVTNLTLKARAAPKMVMRELHAYSVGLVDETSAMLAKMREGAGAEAGGRAARSARAVSDPPSCNTGGKVPSGRKTARGAKSS
jgi:hypothetical protein